MVGRWIANIHRRATRTLVPSTASLTRLEALGVPNLHVWRQGVPLDVFGPANRCARLRTQWVGRWPDTVVVGYVGRLAPENHIRRLAEIVSVPGTKLLVIGDGPSRGWLQRRIPAATFTGRLDGRDLARAFASLDVFVQPGENELFCRTVQEAQASGVPVVAPAVGGSVDLVESGITGLFYDPADKRSLRRTVATLAADPQLRARLANQARESASTRGWPSMVDELLALHYPAVLTHSAANPAA